MSAQSEPLSKRLTGDRGAAGGAGGGCEGGEGELQSQMASLVRLLELLKLYVHGSLVAWKLHCSLVRSSHAWLQPRPCTAQKAAQVPP